MRHPFDGIIGADPPQAPVTRRSLLGKLLAAVLGLYGLTARAPAQVRPGGASPSTRRFLEEGGGRGPRPSSHAYYEDGGRPRPTTNRLGEEGGQNRSRPTTQRTAEEGGRTPPSRPTTQAVGEEGGKRA